MRLRSLARLDLGRSWQRLLHQVRADVMDVPDRFPFEVAARFWDEPPTLREDHQVERVLRVRGTKPGQATARPFVAVHPADLLLYQSLVDSIRDEIENTLGSRDEVLGYRLSPIETDDPFDGSPRWKEFAVAKHQLALEDIDGYVIEGDVASYFLNINVAELERRLLEAGCHGDVVRDLGGLLHAWNAQGIRGLPQGIFPSSPLANFYLAPVDKVLRDGGAKFARYMDDLAIFSPSHHAARALLDEVEDTLYEDGLSLGGGKTWISRSETVLQRLTPEEGIDQFIAELEDAGDYAPDEDEIEEIRLDQVCEIFNDAVAALGEDKYKRSEFTMAYRQLGRRKHPHALEQTPYVLLRMPGLTSVAARYLASVATEEHQESVAAVLREISVDRFHRPQEWLHILRAVQVVPNRAAESLVGHLGELAVTHGHPLVRARALLAWGRQSAEDDFGIADAFFERAPRQWLAYAFVAIQDKTLGARDDRYARWAGEGRRLARLADLIQAARFSWRKI